MLEVKQIMVELQLLKHKFVHIVLTDGEDTSSKNSSKDMKDFFTKLGELGVYICVYVHIMGTNKYAFYLQIR